MRLAPGSDASPTPATHPFALATAVVSAPGSLSPDSASIRFAAAFRAAGAASELVVEPVAAGYPITRNRLLASLPADEFERLRPYLERVELRQRAALFEIEEPIRHVYFPETAVVSLVARFQEARTVEVGTVGHEGMAGLPLFLGDDSSSLRCFAQIPGTALRIEAAAFRRLCDASSTLHHTLLRYTHAFMMQVAQTAACNNVHLVQQRCARWLLLTHDRVGGDLFPLTHEFLAFMLGVRRAGVTTAMRALQDLDVIRYTRGAVAIVDRAQLERASCECYAAVRQHIERMLPPTALA